MSEQEILEEEQTPEEPAPPPLPAVRVVTETYDASNHEHLRQWNAAGKPSDAGEGWGPTFWEDLAEDGETYVRRPNPPSPAPVTDVDRARQYAEAYAAAEQIIFLLMGRVAPALVVGGFFTPETVNAEGTRFMAFHRDLIIDFKNSGRHPDAGTALYNAIAATPSTTAFPWLLANGGAILAVFGNGLPRNA